MSGEKTKSFSKAEEKFFLKVGENFYPEREKKISPEIAQSHACDRSLEELRILLIQLPDCIQDFLQAFF